MSKSIAFSVGDDIYEKFLVAVKLSGVSQNEAIEKCMKTYISEAFTRASQAFDDKIEESGAKQDDIYFAKAIQQIPVWACSPEQYNHRIIRAYFKSIEITGEATLGMMERLCSEKVYPELYVPSFKSKFALMEVDGPKNKVKVFEDDGRNVWIWSEVERTLLRYRQDFRE